MGVAATAVKVFREACDTYDVSLRDSDIKEIILGVRSRLRDVAAEGSFEEQTNAAIIVLQPLVTELKFASAGKG